MASATACFGACIYTVVCSTVTSILGPTMALKGTRTEAMRLAVEHMKADRRTIVRAFAIALATFLVVCFLLILTKLLEHQWYNAMICILILLLAVIALILSVRKQLTQYSYEERHFAAIGADVDTGAEAKMSGQEYLARAQKVRRAEDAQSCAAPVGTSRSATNGRL